MLRLMRMIVLFHFAIGQTLGFAVTIKPKTDIEIINDVKSKNPVIGKVIEEGYGRLLGSAFNSVSSALDAPAKQQEHKFRMEENKAKVEAIGAQVKGFFKDPRTLAGIVGIVGSFFILKYGTELTAKYIESKMGKPQLVQETSMRPWYSKALSVFRKTPNGLSSKDIILATAQKKEFIDIVKITERNRIRNHGYSHILFYGPPGTGKTLGAKIISQMSGMDYAIVAGSSFSQFDKGKDVQELDKLIRWANGSSKGIVLFIDEADSALGIRNGKSERADNLVNFFLSNFEKTTHPKIKLVLATNHPERLDPAIMSRISKTVYVGLPGYEERLSQIKLNFEKIFVPTKEEPISIDPLVLDNLAELASMTENFTGRELYDLVTQLKNSLIVRDTNHLTWDITKEEMEIVMKTHTDREQLRATQTNHTYFSNQK